MIFCEIKGQKSTKSWFIELNVNSCSCISTASHLVINIGCLGLNHKIEWHRPCKCYSLVFPNSNGGVMSHSLAAAKAEK